MNKKCIYTQSKKDSIIEAFTSVIASYIINLTLTMTVLPLLGINLDLQDELLVAILYTVIGVIKNYLIRRHFDKLTKRRVKRLIKERKHG